MAASATGRRAVDRLRAEALGEAVLAFAGAVLAPGGACLVKLVRGAEARLQATARPLFRSTRLLRPAATRSDSSEIFLLAGDRRPRD
jgi:23S rRNA (uridine2552-2'-O)-methyltransferase